MSKRIRDEDINIPTTRDLYETYLRFFIDETKEMVDGMTPPSVSRILSKSIGTSSTLSVLRTKHFPDLSPTYIMDVIEDLGTRSKNAKLSGSDCVFFVKENGGVNADYTRGLVAFYVIADVISSTSTDIASFLPKTVEHILRVISTLDVNSYKLQCSRHTYIESLSKELMEIVTVLLPKDSELLEKASRVNVSSRPMKSARVTPMLFMGVMFALSSIMSVGAMAQDPEGEKSVVMTEVSGSAGFKVATGIMAGAVAGSVSNVISNSNVGSFVGSFGGLMGDGKIVQKNIQKFEEIQQNNAKNTVVVLLESIKDKLGVDLEFSFEPISHNIYRGKATKLAAGLQILAERYGDRLNDPSDRDLYTIKGDLQRDFIDFLRGIDPTNDIFFQDSGGFNFVVEKESGKAVNADGFLEDVTKAIFTTLKSTHLAIKDRANAISIYKKSHQIGDDAEKAGMGTELSDHRLREADENIKKLEKEHLIVSPGELDQIQDFMQILSMVMGVDDMGSNVIFKHVCKDGFKCRPITFSFSDPTLSDGYQMAQALMAVSASSGLNVRGINIVELRNVSGRNNNNAATIKPFAHYQEMSNLESAGFSATGVSDFIDAGMPENIVSTFVQEVLEFQKMNLLDPGYDSPTREALTIAVWNAFDSAEFREVVGMHQLQQMFGMMYHESLNIDTLLIAAQTFIRENNFNKGTFPSDIRDAVRDQLPNLLKPLLSDIFKKAGLSESWVKQLIDSIDKSPASNYMANLISSRRAAFMLNKEKKLHMLISSIPWVRSIAWLIRDKSNDKIKEILVKVRSIIDGQKLDDDFNLPQEEIDMIIKLMKIPHMGDLDMGRLDDAAFNFVNAYRLWQGTWCSIFELIVFIVWLWSVFFSGAFGKMKQFIRLFI